MKSVRVATDIPLLAKCYLPSRRLYMAVVHAWLDCAKKQAAEGTYKYGDESHPAGTSQNTPFMHSCIGQLCNNREKLQRLKVVNGCVHGKAPDYLKLLTPRKAP